MTKLGAKNEIVYRNGNRAEQTNYAPRKKVPEIRECSICGDHIPIDAFIGHEKKCKPKRTTNVNNGQVYRIFMNICN